MHSLFFDGRKDHTIINIQKGSKWYRQKVLQEHISLIEEPGSKYLGHVTPASGTAEDVKQSLMNFLHERYESLDKFVAIGCDGTNVNTGRKGGIIALMEQELQKPLQWLICQLHANELPLRHLLIHLDGATSGPHAFKGKIGKAMSVCETLPIVDFTPIESNIQVMTDAEIADLSTDQKYLSSCKDGARHLFQTIYKSRYLSKKIKSVIDPVIQRNGYFAHPENVLLSMLTDERKHIRELAMRRILRARSEKYGVRKFAIPKINFEAEDYIDLIDWQNTAVFEPPILTNTAVDDLEMFVANGEAPVIDFPKYPCHTQSVERCIKLVTEASAAVCGLKARDGFIRVRLESRKIMPSFNTKAEYRTA